MGMCASTLPPRHADLATPFIPDSSPLVVAKHRSTSATARPHRPTPCAFMPLPACSQKHAECNAQ